MCIFVLSLSFPFPSCFHAQQKQQHRTASKHYYHSWVIVGTGDTYISTFTLFLSFPLHHLLDPLTNRPYASLLTNVHYICTIRYTKAGEIKLESKCWSRKRASCCRRYMPRILLGTNNMFRSIHRHEQRLNTVRWTHIWYLYHKIRARSMQCEHRPYNSVYSKLLTRLECLFVTCAYCLKLKNIYSVQFKHFVIDQVQNLELIVWSRELRRNIVLHKQRSNFFSFIFPLFLCVTKECLFKLNRKFIMILCSEWFENCGLTIIITENWF